MDWGFGDKKKKEGDWQQVLAQGQSSSLKKHTSKKKKEKYQLKNTIDGK